MSHHRITEIWLFCSIDPLDSEGIISYQSVMFAASDRARVNELRPLAAQMARETGNKVVLKRFFSMAVEEEFGNESVH